MSVGEGGATEMGNDLTRGNSRLANREVVPIGALVNF